MRLLGYPSGAWKPFLSKSSNLHLVLWKSDLLMSGGRKLHPQFFAHMYHEEPRSSITHVQTTDYFTIFPYTLNHPTSLSHKYLQTTLSLGRHIWDLGLPFPWFATLWMSSFAKLVSVIGILCGRQDGPGSVIWTLVIPCLDGMVISDIPKYTLNSFSDLFSWHKPDTWSFWLSTIFQGSWVWFA